MGRNIRTVNWFVYNAMNDFLQRGIWRLR